MVDYGSNYGLETKLQNVIEKRQCGRQKSDVPPDSDPLAIQSNSKLGGDFVDEIKVTNQLTFK